MKSKLSLKNKGLPNRQDKDLYKINTFTDKVNYFDKQYDKYIHDPNNVLNVITIKEQIEGYEILTESEYLKLIRRRLKEKDIDELIKEKKKEEEKNKEDINYINTDIDFQEYFKKKKETFNKSVDNIMDKKIRLERLRHDAKQSRIKYEKRKLENITLTEKQKQSIEKNIVNLQNEEIKIDDNIGDVQDENSNNNIGEQKELKNKFYPK